LTYFCRAVNKETQSIEILAGQCAGPDVCPLSCVKAGTVVCIKELSTSPETQARLREMGLGEEQQIKLVSHNSSIICQVCNARLGISKKLAEAILVEPVRPKSEAA
jgi:Fe2+ transport system protein FeoA